MIADEHGERSPSGMMRSFALHVIALSICIFANNFEHSSCTSTEDETPALEDLQQMLSTEEKIWLTMATYDTKPRNCIYWEKNGLNSTDYDFYYGSKVTGSDSNRGVSTGKTHKLAKIGYLDEVPYPVMIIRGHEEEEEQAKVYLLPYWLESEKCFILLNQDGECEQYTWESMISKRHECNKVFFDTCGPWNYPVFKPSCLDS
ncbi:uncharacterized protein LOC119180951 [Rhipicephalus microplus]|uniref:uncharacterized protein LOC119180951 n=1 Tax=Rhipicephalus microplus TaxID=6941 RepID=UPI003F6CCB70